MLSRVTNGGDQQLFTTANSRGYQRVWRVTNTSMIITGTQQHTSQNVDLIKVRMKTASQAQEHSAKMVAGGESVCVLYFNIPWCLSPKHKRAARKCNDLQGEMKIKKVGFNVQKIGLRENKQHRREKGDFSHSFGFNKLCSWAREDKTSSKTWFFFWPGPYIKTVCWKCRRWLCKLLRGSSTGLFPWLKTCLWADTYTRTLTQMHIYKIQHKHCFTCLCIQHLQT